MYPHSAPLHVWLGFPFIAIILAAVFIFAHRQAALAEGAPSGEVKRRTSSAFVIAAGWCALWTALPLGLPIADFDRRPPPFALALASMLLVGAGYALSKHAAPLAMRLPLAALILFHVFSLPLELLMHEAANAGVMPPQMSYSGWNFDILTGATAPVAAWLYSRGIIGLRGVAIWNALGCALLAIILTVAVASTPTFAAFGPEPARLNTWVAYFPFISLPAVMVVCALGGHVLVWRRIAAGDR